MSKINVKRTDKEIIFAIREGKDKEVIGSLYTEVLPNVEHYVCSNNGSKAEAFDMFHDALLIFYKSVIEGNFNDEKYKVYGFIFTISKNLWINQAKRKGVAKKWEDQQNFYVSENSAIENLIQVEEQKILEELFQRLDPNCKQLLNMSIYQKMSMKEIADKLGNINESRAKVQCYRCRKKLSEMVKNNPSLIKLLKY